MYDVTSYTKEEQLKNTKKSSKTGLKASVVSKKKIDMSVSIFGVPLFGTRKSEVLRKIYLQRKELLHVTTVNSEFVMEARINDRFKSILAQTLTVADGYGVVWAARLLRGANVERISGTELVAEILRHAAVSGEKVFLLGAREGIAEQAALAMSTKYPGIRLASYSGAVRVSLEKSEEASMTIAKINAYDPDYLLVAYGRRRDALSYLDRSSRTQVVLETHS
jgi:N-acetylglucosaminyldiphosphoundecaprenol N-acetyl-beta-D-mannosaminyltransferase